MINILGKTYILATRLENHGVFADRGNFEQETINHKVERPRKLKKENLKFKTGSFFKFLNSPSQCPSH
ncbi:hypothetical protein WH96_12245 [Kiloniella spongiae]|uniref:Uncharacterized protein n=1 Tax=Kiloniella spongiae TaxID=1489064 RepID=A0A0H2ME66_9PROT|nr:hypothetical protein WH96_12245 [Kiloniella spongiae]